MEFAYTMCFFVVSLHRLINKLGVGMRKMSLVWLFMSFFMFRVEAQSLKGAWEHKEGQKTTRLVADDAYVIVTEFSEAERTFFRTWGGTYTISVQGQLAVNVEFDTKEPEAVAYIQTFSLKVKKKSLELQKMNFDRLDQGTETPLAGNWRITTRMQPDGSEVVMKPGPRKTVKLLTGSTFQWVALNKETREFFGSGGGRYTFLDGEYIETIQFFSRDASRVGAQLRFQAEVNDTTWIHSGKSSKGEPIREVWTKKKPD